MADVSVNPGKPWELGPGQTLQYPVQINALGYCVGRRHEGSKPISVTRL
jgi:hypothetical protein